MARTIRQKAHAIAVQTYKSVGVDLEDGETKEEWIEAYTEALLEDAESWKSYITSKTL